MLDPANSLSRSLCCGYLLLASLTDHLVFKPPFSLRFGARDDRAGCDRDDGDSLRQDAYAHGAAERDHGSDWGSCTRGRGYGCQRVDVRPRIIFCESILSPWYMASTPRQSTPAVAKQPSGTSGFRPPNMFCRTNRSRRQLQLERCDRCTSCGASRVQDHRNALWKMKDSWCDSRPCHHRRGLLRLSHPDRRLAARDRARRNQDSQAR